MSFKKNWESSTTEQKKQVIKEFREIGLKDNQIESLMKFNGNVSHLDIELMLKLPDNRHGNRPSIWSAKNAIRDCKRLGVIE